MVSALFQGFNGFPSLSWRTQEYPLKITHGHFPRHNFKFAAHIQEITHVVNTQQLNNYPINLDVYTQVPKGARRARILEA